MSAHFPWHNISAFSQSSGIHVIELRIKLTPKAAHDRIQGIFYDSQGTAFLKVSVTAPPVDGRANEALITYLSKKLKYAKSAFTLVRGQTDRYKFIHLYINDPKSDSLQTLQKSLLP